MSCQEIEIPNSCEVAIQRDRNSYTLFYSQELQAHKSISLERGKCYRIKNGFLEIKHGMLNTGMLNTIYNFNTFIIHATNNTVNFQNDGNSNVITKTDDTITFNVVIPKPGGRKRSRISRRKSNRRFRKSRKLRRK